MKRKRYKRFKKNSFKFNPKVVLSVILLVVVICVFVGLGYLIYASNIFRVSKGNVVSDIQLEKYLYDRIEGKSLFTLDVQSIASDFKNSYPEYEEVFVFKEFPSRVRITAKKRIPFAQVKEKQFYPIDKEGVVLSDGSDDVLPGLISIEVNNYKQFLKKGSNVKDSNLNLAFYLIEALKENGFCNQCSVRLINPLKSEVITFFINYKVPGSQDSSFDKDIKIIVPRNGFKEKIELLRGVIDNELKDKISLVKYIDLSHKKIYVGFWR